MANPTGFPRTASSLASWVISGGRPNLETQSQTMSLPLLPGLQVSGLFSGLLSSANLRDWHSHPKFPSRCGRETPCTSPVGHGSIARNQILGKNVPAQTGANAEEAWNSNIAIKVDR